MKNCTPITGIVSGRKAISTLKHTKPAQWYSRHTLFPRFQGGKFVAAGKFRTSNDFEHRVAVWNRLIRVVDLTGMTPSRQPSDLCAPEGWESFRFWAALDHRSFWITATKQELIWCEPYGDGLGSTVDKTIAALQAAGWHAKQLGGEHSVWNPDGGTVAVLAAREPEVIADIEELLANNFNVKPMPVLTNVEQI